MKPAKNIEKHIKNIYVESLPATTSADLDARVLGNVMVALEESKKKKSSTNQPNIWTTIMKSRITRLATAAVIAIAMIPLTYGAAAIVKRLIVGSIGIDQFKGEFKLSENIPVELRIGTKKERRVVCAGNIRFFREGEEVLGTLRCSIGSWPKFKWRTEVELLADGKVLNHTEHVSENGGVRLTGHISWFEHDIHFSLGSWSDVSQAQFFRVGFEQMPQESETTPQAWVEAEELEVVHGRVTGPNGEPIANATIQIREKRKAGQMSISAPDVYTDKQGYYSHDGINWAYKVGALLYEELYESAGYRFQYKRLNKVLEGTQTVDFRFDEFPKGSTILSGRAEGPEGEVIENFTVLARMKVNWGDYSSKYLYQFGYRIPFDTIDGKFEMSGLPPGKYSISIGPRNYECMLVNAQRTEINTENAQEKVWYGRVMFDDGTPAVLELPGIETRIVRFAQGYAEGRTIAKVNTDGYFTAYISDEVMEQLRTGRSSLSIHFSKTNHFHSIRKEKFPVELLSLSADEAGAVRIRRPSVYYGRVLYENGKPAVPQIAPWQGARVYVILRYTDATSTHGGLTEELGNVDKQGYFTVYLTDEQLEYLENGKYKIQIYHPSYEDERCSYPIASFPVELLARAQDSVRDYKIPYPSTREFKNIRQQLESAENLRRLGSALSTYYADNADNFPASLDELKSDGLDELLIWVKENIEYLGRGEIKTDFEFAERVLAYDEALLEKAKGTNVLFVDGHVEFCRPKRLQSLGID